jgi:hypothetical protein
MLEILVQNSTNNFSEKIILAVSRCFIFVPIGFILELCYLSLFTTLQHYRRNKSDILYLSVFNAPFSAL